MNELHGSQEELIFVPEEGQQRLPCSNGSSSCCPSLGENLFSQETINSIIELGEVLKAVRKRMSSEGYTIVDGQVKKLDVIKF